MVISDAYPQRASGPASARIDRGRLVIAAELLSGHENLGVGGIPQPAPVDVGAQLPQRGHQLPRPHLGDEFSQRTSFKVGVRSVFSRKKI